MIELFDFEQCERKDGLVGDLMLWPDNRPGKEARGVVYVPEFSSALTVLIKRQTR